VRVRARESECECASTDAGNFTLISLYVGAHVCMCVCARVRDGKSVCAYGGVSGGCMGGGVCMCARPEAGTEMFVKCV